MGSTVSTSLKSTIRRDWRDVEPKVYAALVGGTAVAAVVTIARLTGHPLPVEVVAELPVLAGVAAAYVKASTHKGGLAEQVQSTGLADAVTIAEAVAVAAPAAAPYVDDATQVLTDLGFDPAGASTSLSPAVTATIPVAPATV